MQAALELYDILSESNIDLRQPVGLDSEGGQSMLQLLQVLLLHHLPCQHCRVLE